MLISWNHVSCCTNVRENAFEMICNRLMTLKITQGHRIVKTFMSLLSIYYIIAFPHTLYNARTKGLNVCKKKFRFFKCGSISLKSFTWTMNLWTLPLIIRERLVHGRWFICFQLRRHQLHQQQERTDVEGHREGCCYTLDFRTGHCCSFGWKWLRASESQPLLYVPAVNFDGNALQSRRRWHR